MHSAPGPAPRVTIVVARARNGVIGLNNALPWRLPEDLRHFKALTIGHAIVMGRNTFESIGRALPGRRSIVVTRNPDWRHVGCERASSLDEAIALAARPGPDRSIATDEVFVIGGAQLYREALARADRAIVTEIDLAPEGDVHFPALAPPDWTLRAHSAHVSEKGVAYRIEDWARAREPDDGEH